MIIVNKSLCDYCGTCVAVCDGDAIDLFHEDIRINHPKCVRCMKCVQVCPIGAASWQKGKKDGE